MLNTLNGFVTQCSTKNEIIKFINCRVLRLIFLSTGGTSTGAPVCLSSVFCLSVLERKKLEIGLVIII